MNDHDIELLEKIRQQYNGVPYPNTPLETTPKNDFLMLFFHSLATPHYLYDRSIVGSAGKVILDAGCGSGYKSLVLAEANPGAKIVGVDLSEASVDLAEKRLQFYGFDNIEFHALSIYDLPKLGLKFDYINCDEVLYLLPDVQKGLEVMKSVLNPGGMIRTNLHSSTQRTFFFRGQQMFGLMGLMDSNPEDMEVEIAVETMEALKDHVTLKASTWRTELYGTGTPEAKQKILVNYLLLGDKGFTIPQTMDALNHTDLEFVSMLMWNSWDLSELFADPTNLPEFWQKKLPELSIAQRLEMCELIHPRNRLIDFWCKEKSQTQPSLGAISEWCDADWENTIAHLHPVLNKQQIKEDLLGAVQRQQPYEITCYIPASSKSRFLMDTGAIACILPLWDKPQRFTSLVEHSLKVRPVNGATLEPTSREEAIFQVQQALTALESILYVFLERP